MAAGLTYVSLDNQTQNPADAQFGILPEGLTLDQVAKRCPSRWLFHWFNDTVFDGGPVAQPGAQGAAVVDFSAGEWIIANTGDNSTAAPVALKVTGESEKAKSGAVKSDLKVTEKGYKYDFPNEVAAGPQVWEVSNEDAVPHVMVLLRYPGPVTEKDVQDILSMNMGTPVAEMAIDPSKFEDAGEIPFLSQGETSWQEVEWTPGTCVALCFVSDKGSEVPHAAMGMFDIFTVPGDVATPTS